MCTKWRVDSVRNPRQREEREKDAPQIRKKAGHFQGQKKKRYIHIMPATTANDDDGGDRSFLGRRRRANRGCPNVFVLTPSCVLISPPENLGGFGFRAHKKGDSRLTSLEERKVRVFGLLDTRGLTITANLKYVNARE